MDARAKTILSTTLLAAAGFLIVYSLAGPNGVPMVLRKGSQIRELEQQNADLQRDIDMKNERIRSFKENRSDQELEIRRDLRLLKKKETTFVIPGKK